MCHGQLINSAILHARKQHRCDDCGRDIKPGEKYQRQAQKDGRHFDTWKGCRECAIKSKVLWAELGEDACYADLRDGLKEIAGDIGWKKMRVAFAEARAFLFGNGRAEA